MLQLFHDFTLFLRLAHFATRETQAQQDLVIRGYEEAACRSSTAVYNIWVLAFNFLLRSVGEAHGTSRDLYNKLLSLTPFLFIF